MSGGIYFGVGSEYCNFSGCVSICSFSGCDEIATKYYIRGEDKEFWEMYEKTNYAKLESEVRDIIVVLGFCDFHSSDRNI